MTTDLSSHEARFEDVGEKVQSRTQYPCPLRVAICLFSNEDQNLMTLSSPQLAKMSPSQEKLRALILELVVFEIQGGS